MNPRVFIGFEKPEKDVLSVAERLASALAGYSTANDEEHRYAVIDSLADFAGKLREDLATEKAAQDWLCGVVNDAKTGNNLSPRASGIATRPPRYVYGAPHPLFVPNSIRGLYLGFPGWAPSFVTPTISDYFSEEQRFTHRFRLRETNPWYQIDEFKEYYRTPLPLPRLSFSKVNGEEDELANEPADDYKGLTLSDVMAAVVRTSGRNIDLFRATPKTERHPVSNLILWLWDTVCSIENFPEIICQDEIKRNPVTATFPVFTGCGDHNLTLLFREPEAANSGPVTERRIKVTVERSSDIARTYSVTEWRLVECLNYGEVLFEIAGVSA